MTRSLEVGMC